MSRPVHAGPRRPAALPVPADSWLRTALDGSLDGFAIYRAEQGPGEGPQLRMQFVNRAGAVGIGRPAAELVGRTLTECYPAAEAMGLQAEMLAVLRTGVPRRDRFTEPATVPAPRTFESTQLALDADTILSTWRDVTDLLRGERLLAAAYEDAAEVRATLQTAIDAAAEGFAVLDVRLDAATRQVTDVSVRHGNAAAQAALGGPAPDADLLAHLDRIGVLGPIRTALEDVRPVRARCDLHDPAGSWLSADEWTVSPVTEDRVVVTVRDVTGEETARRSLERTREEAEHAATHDPLTGLPNRTLLRRRLAELLGRCGPRERVAVAFVDLDGFKDVNDVHGHAAGDAVLKATARRLERCVRPQDLASRIAGDEFVLVLGPVTTTWSSSGFADRTATALAEPVWVEGAVLAPSASVGVVVVDPHGEDGGRPDVDRVLERADRAMYARKALRREGRSPSAEARRLRELSRYQVPEDLDPRTRELLTSLATSAALVCRVPAGMVTFVEDTTVFVAAGVAVGPELPAARDAAGSRLPREIAFCDTTIRGRDCLVVPDLARDARFAGNPLVHPEGHGEDAIRFYAGAPVVTPSGEALGAVCALGVEPADLDDGQRAALAALARAATDVLEQRLAGGSARAAS